MCYIMNVTFYNSTFLNLFFFQKITYISFPKVEKSSSICYNRESCNSSKQTRFKSLSPNHQVACEQQNLYQIHDEVIFMRKTFFVIKTNEKLRDVEI